MSVDVKKSIATIAAVAALSGGVIEGTKPVEPIDTVAVHEIVSLRTETAKVFQEVDGKHRAVITTQPQHWRDKDGKYKAIDTTVQARAFLVKAFSAYDYETAFTGDTSALFKSGESPDYAVKTGGYSVAYALLSDTTGVDITTETTTRGVKQTYTLKNEKAAATLRWLIETDAAMTREGDGFVFANNEGGFLWRLDPPKVWDANSAVVPVTVSTAGDTLTWAVDTAKAAFPVTVDPSTVISVNTSESGLMTGYHSVYLTARSGGGSISQDLSGDTPLIGQSNGANYYIRRLFFKFDTSALPDDAVIDSVRMKSLYIRNDYPASLVLYLCQSNYNWTTSLSYDSFTGFNASGAHTPTYLSADSVYTYPLANPDSISWKFNSTGISAVSKTGNTYVVMLSNLDIQASTAFENQCVKKSATYLSIYYRPPYTPVPTGFTLSNPSATGMSASWTNHHTSGIDSLFLTTGAYAWVKHLDKADTSTTITGLTPNTQYIYRVAVDSTGTGTGYSNADTLYTLAEAPSLLALAEYDSTHVDISYSIGSNPAGSLFAVRDSTTQKWKDATGADTSTKTWRTLAQWQAVHLTVTKDVIVRLGVVGKNGDGVETAYLWGTIATNNKKTFEIPVAYWTSKTADDSTYNVARSENTPSGINNGSSYEFGQQLSGGIYSIWRLSGAFKIPACDSIVTARLILSGSGNESATDFNVNVYQGTWAADSDDSRYYQFDGYNAGGAFTGTSMVNAWSTASYADGWADSLTFTEAGENIIETVLGDSLKVALTSSRDAAGTAPSGNEFVGFSSAKLLMTYYDYDHVPSGLSVTSLAPNQVIVSWTDNAATETGYYVVDGSTLAVLGSITNANATSDTVYVTPNTIKTFKILISGGKVDGEYSAASNAFCTDPGTLSAPVLTDLGGGLVKVRQDTSGSGNPADTDIASLFYTSAGDSYYVHNGALVSGVPHADSTNGWRTYDLWGASNGDTIQVEPGRTYTVKSIARTREY